MGSEYDVRPVVEQLHKDGITILLPYVSHMNQTLVFYPYTPGHSIKDILGFSIPVSRETSFQPDYIFAPLLAADMIGNRLGYGGGYYDRTLSGICKKIVYIGVGYSFQRVSSLNPSKNDVPLMGYVDEFGLDTFGNKFNDI
jgi:5-formyltetrahydrofolate cyclo-ligase